jgi:hypothetical protein
VLLSPGVVEYHRGGVAPGEGLVTLGPTSAADLAERQKMIEEGREWDRFLADMALIGGVAPASMGGTGTDPSRIGFTRAVNVRTPAMRDRIAAGGAPAYLRIPQTEFTAEDARDSLGVVNNGPTVDPPVTVDQPVITDPNGTAAANAAAAAAANAVRLKEEADRVRREQDLRYLENALGVSRAVATSPRPSPIRASVATPFQMDALFDLSADLIGSPTIRPTRAGLTGSPLRPYQSTQTLNRPFSQQGFANPDGLFGPTYSWQR